MTQDQLADEIDLYTVLGVLKSLGIEVQQPKQ